MKKIKIAVLAALMGVLLSGCKNSGSTSTFSPEQSSIFVTREGAFSSALIEPYEHDYYDQTELQAAIEAAVAAYNAGHGGSGVSLSSCKLADGKATALFSYTRGTDLCAFADETKDQANQADRLELSTIEDGLVEGKVSDGTWVKVKDGSEVSLNTVIKQGKLHLLTLEGTATVQTEGKIEYTSGAVTLLDDFTAQVAGGKAYIAFK
ncbi:MAG: hypothetical protein RSB57_07920 [Hungatella sp.]